MAVLNLDTNGAFGENGVGKLYICTNFAWVVYDNWTGTNEDEAVTALAALTYADIGYFENFSVLMKKGDERVIMTDYCDIGEISRKTELVPWFKADVQEILEMVNLAKILGASLNTTQVGFETIGIKRTMKTNPYQLFRFVTCPKSGKSTTFYFVKASLAADFEINFINLNRDDFTGVTLEFEVAEGWNIFVSKAV